ncbi:MAG: hypothetical protein HUJ96_07085 [Marinilabiliaceae bacterium]|nr:hypothetical protein [Marinilabiliaceae bacterium]
MKQISMNLSELMNRLSSDLSELSHSEMEEVNGGVYPIWYYLGKWARARFDGMLEDVENGIYID